MWGTIVTVIHIIVDIAPAIIIHFVLDSLTDKSRGIRKNSGYRRASICEDLLNVRKCNRVLVNGKCVTKQGMKKCQKTCGLCGGKI